MKIVKKDKHFNTMTNKYFLIFSLFLTYFKRRKIFSAAN
jgi:hypothetical protein